MARTVNPTSLALFFLNPFLLFISSLRNNRAAWAPNALWAFVVFFGFTFAIGAESQESDIVRYVELNEFFYENVNSVQDAITIYVNSGEIDFIRYVVAFIVSRITDSQSVFIASLALIFGFFYSRNVFLLFRQFKGQLHYWTWVLVVVFLLVVPFWEINGFRFWTATHVFLYGVLVYLLEGKKRGQWFCGLSFLFHFSFVVPIIALIIYHFIPKNLSGLLVVFAITLFVREFDITPVNNALNQYAPTIFVERAGGYLETEKVEQFRSVSGGKIWYAIWYLKGLQIVISVLLILAALKFIKWIHQVPAFHSLLAFTLLMYSVANILSSVPSGGRFLKLALLLAVFCITTIYQNYYRNSLKRYWLPLASPAFALFILVSIRIGFYFISVTTLVGNPIVAFFTANNNLAIIDIIKGL